MTPDDNGLASHCGRCLRDDAYFPDIAAVSSLIKLSWPVTADTLALFGPPAALIDDHVHARQDAREDPP
ncbi:hypothetical protein ACIPC1_35760 [Streptomyces sp. NPDC087263]|uniref:hypothetical protein n=1 Tax=Streptomyces sp. NPDC087263 TaxID=3365773 RepID=UPI003805C90A